MRHLISVLVLAAACGGPPLALDTLDAATLPDGADPTGDAGTADAPPGQPDGAPGQPDAAPADAGPPTLGQSIVFDDIHIAGILEEMNSFSLLGMAINPQFQTWIDDGSVLDGIELRSLDDPSGQNDGALDIGFYPLDDTDADLTDNFNADAPELFSLGTGAMVSGVPTCLFAGGSISGGTFTASASGDVGVQLLPDGIPLPLRDPQLEGRLHAGGGGTFVRTMDRGRLRGAVRGVALYLIPNPVSEICAGTTFLDVIVTGCGIAYAAQQPDIDIDADGLEEYLDTDADSRVDQCIDGDGSVTNGTTCPLYAWKMQDGYSIVFVLEGVRGSILAP